MTAVPIATTPGVLKPDSVVAVPHHDNVPTLPPQSKPLNARLEDQRNYLVALRSSSILLNEAGIKQDDFMVMAGGSVFLYELAKGVKPQNARAPTDLDIVIRHNQFSERRAKDLIAGATSFQRGHFDTVRHLTEARHHHGYVFPTAVVEAKVNQAAGVSSQFNPGKTHFDVDLIPGPMTTIFPKDHAFPELRGVAYPFPIDRADLFKMGPLLNVTELAKRVGIAVTDIGEVRAAPVAFVAFYKVSMLRNAAGKQDSADIIRLHDMGLLDPNCARFQGQMRMMTDSHPERSDRPALFRNVMDRITRIIRSQTI